MLLRDATREFPPIFVALAGTLKVPLRHADPRVVNDDEPQCPTCRIDLAPTMYETAIVWACPVCTGTFMPRDQLYAITANMTHPRSDAERLDALHVAH